MRPGDVITVLELVRQDRQQPGPVRRVRWHGRERGARLLDAGCQITQFTALFVPGVQRRAHIGHRVGEVGVVGCALCQRLPVQGDGLVEVRVGARAVVAAAQRRREVAQRGAARIGGRAGAPVQRDGPVQVGRLAGQPEPGVEKAAEEVPPPWKRRVIGRRDVDGRPARGHGPVEVARITEPVRPFPQHLGEADLVLRVRRMRGVREVNGFLVGGDRGVEVGRRAQAPEPRTVPLTEVVQVAGPVRMIRWGTSTARRAIATASFRSATAPYRPNLSSRNDARLEANPAASRWVAGSAGSATGGTRVRMSNARSDHRPGSLMPPTVALARERDQRVSGFSGQRAGSGPPTQPSSVMIRRITSRS
jgi:hypothetical protein